MPRIPYDATNFPASMPSPLRGRHRLALAWNDLIWSAVSVGKSGFDDMLAHGEHSVDEILFRTYMVWANLWEHDGYVYRSPAYDHMDPTEKGSISYFLGMAIAKLFAFKLLNAPWMVHLDRLVDRHAVGLTGRSRPDLAGQDISGRWILMEGKGRTGNFEESALQQAKQQVRQVRQIDGQSPYLRVGAEMYFKECMRVSLDDPDEPRPESVDLRVGARGLNAAYYKRFLPLLQAQRRALTIDGREFAIVDYKTIGVSIGVWTELERLAKADTIAKMVDAEDFSGQDERALGSGPWQYQLYPDGLAVGVDGRWSEEAMSRVPLER